MSTDKYRIHTKRQQKDIWDRPEQSRLILATPVYEVKSDLTFVTQFSCSSLTIQCMACKAYITSSTNTLSGSPTVDKGHKHILNDIPILQILNTFWDKFSPPPDLRSFRKLFYAPVVFVSNLLLLCISAWRTRTTQVFRSNAAMQFKRKSKSPPSPI